MPTPVMTASAGVVELEMTLVVGGEDETDWAACPVQAVSAVAVRTEMAMEAVLIAHLRTSLL